MPRPGTDEHGVVLIVYVLALVVICVLAGLAIDLGNVGQTKQTAQDAADNAAVSAVADLAPIKQNLEAVATAEARAVSDAERYIQENYPNLLPQPVDWNSCTGALPAQVWPYPAANCIGFFDPQNLGQMPPVSPSGMAVAIPTQTVKYTFARAAGLTGQHVSALATASLQTAGTQYLLPFPWVGGYGAGCLKNVKNPNSQCGGSFKTGPGSLGMLNSPRYQIFPGYSTAKGNNPFVQADIALGIDHRLNVQGSAPEVCDAEPPTQQSSCATYNNAAPYDDANAVVVLVGQDLTEATQPLFTGGFTVDGCTVNVPRLAHPDGFVLLASNCSAANPSGGPSGPDLAPADTFGSSYPLNGVHITRYLIGGTSSPLWIACYGSSGLDPSVNPIDDDFDPGSGNSSWTGGDSCLSDAMANSFANVPGVTVPIFATDIVASPRFGIVPVVGSSCSTGNSVPCPIVGFDGVFLDMAYSQGGKVSAIAAWAFPLNWIAPGPAGGTGGIGPYNGGPFVTDLCSLPAGNC